MDKTLKIFDVVGFGRIPSLFTFRHMLNNFLGLTGKTTDMINMLQLPYVPSVCEWIVNRASGKSLVAWLATSTY